MTPPAKIPGKKWYWTQLLAALAGAALSVYLLVQHTRLKSGIQGSASFCSFGKYADCDAVNASRFAEFGGIPLAAIGACFYFAILLLGLIAGPKDKKFRRTQTLVAWLAVAGLVVDVVLMFIQLAVLKNLCVLCASTYIATAVILLAAVKLLAPTAPSGWLNAAKSALSPQSFRTAPPLGATAVVLAVLGMAAFVAAMAMTPTFVRQAAKPYAQVDDAMTQYLDEWKKMPVRPIDVKAGDGTFGNPSARVKIVVFSDFQCPFCRKAAFTMSTALHPMKDRVFLIFKHFPLDSTCNPALQYQLHAHACDLARLGFCAEQKGKFWEFHDRVFLTMEESEIEKGRDAIFTGVKDIFSRDEFDRCLVSEAANANIAADLKLGGQLNVRGTPSVFINGKPVAIPLTVENLQRLVQLEQ